MYLIKFNEENWRFNGITLFCACLLWFDICGWLSAGTSYFLSMIVKDDGIQLGAKND